MAPSFYIVDGHAYCYQAFYALSSFTAPDGTPTNAVFGITKLVEKLLKMEPEYLVFCFDPPGPSFRKDIYDQYKANRKPMPEDMRPQIPVIKEVLKAYRIPVLQVKHYEADDVMGTLARQAAKYELDVLLLTGDKDIQQLINDKIKIYDHKKNIVIGRNEVKERLKVEVEQLPDYYALVGDAVDNIPGVKGIGPKTAQSLIQKWQTLEEIYQHLEEIKSPRWRKLLSEHREEAFLSRKLFLIDDQVKIEFDLKRYRRQQGNSEALRSIFQKLGFRSFLAKLPSMPSPAQKKVQVISSSSELLALIELLEKQNLLVLEPDGVENKMWDSTLKGVCFAWNGEQAAYVPLSEENGQLLLPILQNRVFKAAHDIKRVYRHLYNHGIILAPLGFDTVLANYLLTPSLKQFAYNDMCMQYLGESAIEFDSAHVETLAARACQVYRLIDKLDGKLRELELKRLLVELELPLIPVLVEMELSGICLDRKILRAISAQLHSRVGLLEQKIYQMAGAEFNIASTKKLGEILFDKLGLPRGKKTKTGYSTNSDVLEELTECHALPALILEYRQLTKLANTYVDVLPTHIYPQSNRIHTLFHQTGTITGRLSSSEPNLQNIPIRTKIGSKIRKAFVAMPGNVLITADYSQIELRVLAHFSQDPKLLQAFQEEQDIHATVAANIFSLKPEAVSETQRRIAKSVNFGIIYGQSPYGLSKELHIPVKEAKEFIEAYFDHYARVREYIDEIIVDARKNRYVTTLLQRRRYLPDINSSKHAARQFAERAAVNTVMQGSAADIIKKAMIDIYCERNEKMLPFKILLQIHDELIVESPRQSIHEVAALVQQKMMYTIDLSVPLKIKVAVGKNWLEASPLESL